MITLIIFVIGLVFYWKPIYLIGTYLYCLFYKKDADLAANQLYALKVWVTLAKELVRP